jgi:sugar-specific transcriptional regulator TrmB
MATPLNLTPFGFTPTENVVYGRLLDGGPASGYAIARDLVIARANAYQALRGLVAKGAAVVSAEQPQVFRAVRAADVFASIVDREQKKLDELEIQLGHEDQVAADSFVRLTGERAFLDLAARTAARETHAIKCVAPLPVLNALVPSLRKRNVDGKPTQIWVMGDGQFAAPVEASVPPERAQRIFGGPVSILLAGTSVMLARMLGRATSGYWASDPDIVGATVGSFIALTESA